MKTALIALALLTVLTTTSIYLVHQSNNNHSLELESTELFEESGVPMLAAGHGVLHIKVNWSQLGHCANAVLTAAKSCKAVWDSRGKNIIGDINCAKNILSAKSCKHVF